MKAIPKSEIVNIRYREKMEERKALLKSAKSDYAKAAAELDTLRAEVIKSLRGESAFPQDLLSSLISDCETKCLEVQHTMEAAQAAYDEGQAMLDTLNAQYDDMVIIFKQVFSLQQNFIAVIIGRGGKKVGTFQ